MREKLKQNAFYESVLGRSRKLSVSLPMGRSTGRVIGILT